MEQDKVTEIVSVLDALMKAANPHTYFTASEKIDAISRGIKLRNSLAQEHPRVINTVFHDPNKGMAVYMYTKHGTDGDGRPVVERIQSNYPLD